MGNTLTVKVFTGTEVAKLDSLTDEQKMVFAALPFREDFAYFVGGANLDMSSRRRGPIHWLWYDKVGRLHLTRFNTRGHVIREVISSGGSDGSA